MLADNDGDANAHAALAYELSKLAVASRDDGRTPAKLRREAISHYEAAMALGKPSYDTLHNCARLHDRLAEAATSDHAAQRALRLKSIELYGRALQVVPGSHESLHNWGLQLGHLAGLAGGDAEQERMLRREAIAKYKQAVALEPSAYRSALNLGVELSLLAELQRHEPAEAKAIRREAIGHLAQAQELGGARFDTLYNLGVQLGRLADASRSEHGVADLRAQAVAQLQGAVDLAPDRISAVFRLGYELHELAFELGEADPRRRDLLERAVVSLERAAEARPAAQYFKTHLADALLRLAPLLVDEPARQRVVWDSAEQVLVQCAVAAGRVLSQMFPYASLLAQQGSPQALESLSACLEAGTVESDAVRRDPDWAPFREEAAFESLLAPYDRSAPPPPPPLEFDDTTHSIDGEPGLIIVEQTDHGLDAE